jgi:UDP-GlcNAc:undecaprenyl-phosphate GlcNAc-1-phosphate transferase
VLPFEASRPLFAIVVAFAVALALTPFCRSLARRLGFVAPPKEDRWHRKPTAMLGGPAIVLAALAAFLVSEGFRLTPLFAAWIGGAILVSVLGLLDDILHLRPTSKLIGQIIAALVPLYAGLTIGVFHPIVSFWIVLFWIVGIANAFNLLDNMDGLAAGIAAIASVVLAIHSMAHGSWMLACAAASVAGAALGFLVFNFHPASIFMGDGGSLFLGFSLGTLTLIDLGSRPLVSLSIIAVPLLVLTIPIFDTTLVTVLRVSNRRSVTEGGRDHSSHRLVSLGLSERRAVLTLFALSAATGLFSLLVPRFRASLMVLIALLAILLVYYFGAYLGSVPVYRSDVKALEQARRRGFFILDTFIAHKQRILDVTTDLLIIAISYLAAYLLRYEGDLSPANLHLIEKSLPFLVAVRLVCLFTFGLYRTVPGAFSLHDFLAVAKAVIVSSALFVTGLVLVTRFENYSRAVMVIDGILTLSGITFARIALRSLHEIFSSLSEAHGRRVLIVGAGNLGEATVRLLKTDENGGYRIVGFVDDSPDKIGRRLHGFPVLGRLEEAEGLIQSRDIDLVIFASSRLLAPTRSSLEDVCRKLSVESREIRLA